MNNLRKKKPTLDRLVPLMRGAADEILPIAEAMFAELTKDVASPHVDDIRRDMFDGLEDDARSLKHAHPDHDARHYRAALLRVASRVLVLLALDEFKRGARACARDAKMLAPTGHVKR